MKKNFLFILTAMVVCCFISCKVKNAPNNENTENDALNGLSENDIIGIWGPDHDYSYRYDAIFIFNKDYSGIIYRNYNNDIEGTDTIYFNWVLWQDEYSNSTNLTGTCTDDIHWFYDKLNTGNIYYNKTFVLNIHRTEEQCPLFINKISSRANSAYEEWIVSKINKLPQMCAQPSFWVNQIGTSDTHKRYSWNQFVGRIGNSDSSFDIYIENYNNEDISVTSTVSWMSYSYTTKEDRVFTGGLNNRNYYKTKIRMECEPYSGSERRGELIFSKKNGETYTYSVVQSK